MEALAESRSAKERELIDLFHKAPALGNASYPQRHGDLITDFEQAYCCASAQLVASGENAVGERKTPVVSFWPLKDKWKKFGSWFTCIGSDGDATMVDGRLKEPLMLQLYYKVLGDGTVMQLAWSRPDWRIMDDRIVRSEAMTVRVV